MGRQAIYFRTKNCNQKEFDIMAKKCTYAMHISISTVIDIQKNTTGRE